MFKLFWPLSQLNSPALSIPNYQTGLQEDSIDLQIKSLIYMFKRYNISKLGPFLQIMEHGGYKLLYIGKEKEGPADEKLDDIYNKKRFEEALIRDENRILIDYIKNKFRSMLILTDYPREIKEIPEISDDVSFRFSVLHPDASNEEYIQILLNESNFYIEHNVTDELKIELITSILYNQRSLKRNSHLDKQDRYIIIQEYLKRLSFHIQVDRIYKASLKSKEKLSANSSEEAKPKPPVKQVIPKQSFIKSQPTENSYVTKPVPLFLTSPDVKYQSPSRRVQNSPVLEKSPVIKPSGKVTIFDDSMDEEVKHSTLPTAQRTLRASPSRMKLRTSEHNSNLAPCFEPITRQQQLSPHRGINKKVSQAILKVSNKYPEQQQQQQEPQLKKLQPAPLLGTRRRSSFNSSSTSEFSDTGSYSTSLTNFSLENNEASLSEIDREAMYDQCKVAVRIRIERERTFLNGA